MVQAKRALAGDLNATVPADERTWARSHGTYIAGRAWLDEADATAAQMEAKWGVDRLRLLVRPELREKFDRQRYLLNRADLARRARRRAARKPARGQSLAGARRRRYGSRRDAARSARSGKSPLAPAMMPTSPRSCPTTRTPIVSLPRAARSPSTRSKKSPACSPLCRRWPRPKRCCPAPPSPRHANRSTIRY